MLRTSNGGGGHDVVIKLLVSAKDMEPASVFAEMILIRVAAKWPESEPVVIAAVLGQPSDHNESVVYVAIHSQTFFRSRVVHSDSDSNNLIVTHERVANVGPYNANQVLELLSNCPPCVVAIGVSAVSPSYMAEMWSLMLDASLFNPPATYALTASKDGVERQSTDTALHGWDGLV